MEGAYNGTQGSVNRSTSQQRRVASLEQVLNEVEFQGSWGITWRELADRMGLHHGQASGALSNLHKKELVFVARDLTRDKCQVYVSNQWRWSFHPAERIDKPTKTRNTQKIEAIISAAEQVVETGTPIDIMLLELALKQYKNSPEEEKPK